MGTRPQPHSARSCVLWGRHEGARGGRLLPGCGASGVGRSPTPDCPPSGRAGGAHYPLAVGAGGCGRGDPSPTPQRALLRAAFVRCGGGMRVPGGGASCLGVGRPGSGALPPLTASPLGGLPGPTTHWLWVRGGAGVGTRQQPHSARSCELALRAVGAARGLPGGAPPARMWGVRGRALSHPRLPALWAGWRGPLRTGCGCGGPRAWGPVTNPTAHALACCRGGMRVPGGGRLLPVLPVCSAPWVCNLCKILAVFGELRLAMNSLPVVRPLWCNALGGGPPCLKGKSSVFWLLSGDLFSDAGVSSQVFW